MQCSWIQVQVQSSEQSDMILLLAVTAVQSETKRDYTASVLKDSPNFKINLHTLDYANELTL